MEIPDVIKFVMEAGGPTVIAAIALTIIYKLVMKMVPDMMKMWRDTADTMSASRDAHTEALIRLTTSIDHTDSVLQEVKTLLIRLNGGLKT